MKIRFVPGKIFSGIDWKSQMISFAATILGILIAFQLDDYQETVKAEQKATRTYQAIALEITENVARMEDGLNTLNVWLEYIDFIKSHDSLAPPNLVCSEREFHYIVSRNGDRFANSKLIRSYKDTLNVYSLESIRFDFLLPLLSTSNWETAKSSGALNALEHEQISPLTEIYEWLTLDLGTNERKIHQMLSTDQVQGLIKEYRRMRETYRIRLEMIKRFEKSVYQKHK
jgi:hypothetical protein